MEQTIPWRDYRKVIKIGNSVAITLPALFVKAHGIKEGDMLKVIMGEILKIYPPPENPPQGKIP
uniref:AbrB/MazE/SpoVT family DNA-binding domain-containing protein n=1 Tax=Desulfobacca acetoxidans TaxID=60893 RepID=A0A7C3Z0F7_9BACT